MSVEPEPDGCTRLTLQETAIAAEYLRQIVSCEGNERRTGVHYWIVVSPNILSLFRGFFRVPSIRNSRQRRNCKTGRPVRAQSLGLCD